MSRPRYRARRLRAKDGTVIGWGAFLQPPGPLMMAAGFTGPLARWRARLRASALNRKG